MNRHSSSPARRPVRRSPAQRDEGGSLGEGGSSSPARRSPPAGAGPDEGGSSDVILDSREDTIVAISSPVGASPRAIVRLTGEAALPIATRFFRPTPRQSDIDKAAGYSAVEGSLQLGADWPPVPAVVYLMRRPRSYTREDIVEFHVPGSPPLLQEMLRLLLASGARAAEPGEFTKRAFLNGRLDLAQAEAVQRLIHARSEAEMRAALRQIGGSLSRGVSCLHEHTANLLAHVEASIDFSDQEIEIISRQQIAGRITEVRNELAQLVSDSVTGGVAVELPRIVLCGKPNAGKSSLFNALLRRDRAIVTPIAGTTRDVIEGIATLNGLCEALLVDTAGIAQEPDALQSRAGDRARHSAENADLVALVIDASEPLGDTELMRRIFRGRSPEHIIVCLSKSDLPAACSADEVRRVCVESTARQADTLAVVRTTCTSEEGVADLTRAIAAKLLGGGVERTAAHFVLEARHKAALEEADAALLRALHSPEPELTAVELREALAALASILGLDATPDILDRIFSQFCIGK